MSTDRGRGSKLGKGYLYGQGSFSYTAVAQHHQLVQRHLPRHGVGSRSESASSMQVVSSARMRRTGHRSRASCYASGARHVVAESRLVFCSEFAADQRAHSLGWEQWCRSRRGVRRRRGEGAARISVDVVVPDGGPQSHSSSNNNNNNNRCACRRGAAGASESIGGWRRW